MSTWEERQTARAITARANCKPWYRRIEWPLVLVGAIVVLWCTFLGLLFGGVFDAPSGNSGPTASQHYNGDFKRYCNDLYNGRAYIGNRDICMNAAGRVVMREGSIHYLDDWLDKKTYSDTQHYNRDFTMFCKAAHGQPVIGERNICVRDNKIIMRESKY